jgi:hypothetical protein
MDYSATVSPDLVVAFVTLFMRPEYPELDEGAAG